MVINMENPLTKTMTASEEPVAIVAVSIKILNSAGLTYLMNKIKTLYVRKSDIGYWTDEEV